MRFKGESDRTYTVHAEIMPDAILPPFGFARGGFVCVLEEPVVDIAQYHGVVVGAEERLVYELRIGLFLVDHGFGQVLHWRTTTRC
jgi:hypothetical protein